MGFAKLELVQKDSGEIVLQAHDGDEPLLRLRFNRELTRLLGADALDLAQAMVESANDVFEYALESVIEKEELRRDGAAGSITAGSITAGSITAGSISDAADLGASADLTDLTELNAAKDAEPNGQPGAIIRLRTTTLH